MGWAQAQARCTYVMNGGTGHGVGEFVGCGAGYGVGEEFVPAQGMESATLWGLRTT